MKAKDKSKNLKQLGFFTIGLSLIFWFILFSYGETTPQDLKSIEGEFSGGRKVQIVKNSIGDNKSTVISLKNYSNVEFNLGETFDYNRLLTELETAQEPIIIKLNIQKKFFSQEREIVPAFYGFWINNKEIKSDQNGFESNKRNRTIFLTIASVLSILGTGLVIKSKKVSNTV